MSLYHKEVDTSRWTQKIAYNGDNVEYVGQAKPSTLSSEAGWSIKKLTYSGSNVTDVQWANGDAGFIFIWDDRASYTYA